jgi:hypothetical protein
VLEQTIGEAASRRSDIDGNHGSYVYLQVGESSLQLAAAARAIALELGDPQQRIFRHLVTRFFDALVAEKHLSRQDARLSARPALHQAELDKSNVCACFLHGPRFGMTRCVVTMLRKLAEAREDAAAYWEPARVARFNSLLGLALSRPPFGGSR